MILTHFQVVRAGVYTTESLLITPLPLIFFPASRYKIYDFLPHEAIKPYISGLYSVNLRCTHHVLWFSAAKSNIFLKFSFFFLVFPFPFPSLCSTLLSVRPSVHPSVQNPISILPTFTPVTAVWSYKECPFKYVRGFRLPSKHQNAKKVMVERRKVCKVNNRYNEQ